MKPLRFFPSIPSPVSREPLPTRGNKILLLQGPAGPFFRHLQREFETNGYAVKRIFFHRADQLFASDDKTNCNDNPYDHDHRFTGNYNDWKQWLHTELSYSRPDCIVLFGSERPAHTAARQIAQQLSVNVISLEEGYLRAGYITCEIGGNNRYSPLHDWTAGRCGMMPKNPADISSSFLIMCFWNAIYYLWRDLTKVNTEQVFYHRNINSIAKEALSWTYHALRRSFAKFTDRRKISRLLTMHAGKYLLIPLQVPSDSQIQTASRGWTNEKLIKQTLHTLAETPVKKLILVFKTHPLDQHSYRLASMIKREAQTLNLQDQVIILESGKIGELTQRAAGMIVINSTSAFSALHHRTPLLVLGDAIFRRSAIATIGDGAQSIARFFIDRKSKKPADIEAFIQAVKTHALLPGDFYAPKIQQLTARNIVAKIKVQLQCDEAIT